MTRCLHQGNTAQDPSRHQEASTDGNPGKGTIPVNLEGPRSLAYDQGMPVSVSVQTVHPRKLAAVRREVAPGEVGSAWGPAVGKVWEFIRSQPGLRTDGHNIFLYHHAKDDAP